VLRDFLAGLVGLIGRRPGLALVISAMYSSSGSPRNPFADGYIRFLFRVGRANAAVAEATQGKTADGSLDDDVDSSFPFRDELILETT